MLIRFIKQLRLGCIFSGCLYLFLSLLILNASATEKTVKSIQKPMEDVRVLIDISGSMKRTDPQNLRSPALRLFVSLLPEGVHAGVWTFGKWVNMLVKYGEVDKLWKQSASSAAGKIQSTGLYTNIEDALRRATWDWKEPDQSVKRNLILLTDGYVDLSKDGEENVVSRDRIVQEILPRLQKAGVTIHAIALSQDSDKRLLKQLTSATDGRFETIESSDGLERVFLHIFENVSQTDTLPISNNRVIVDESIHELTFLIFRKNEKDITSIASPTGMIIQKDELPNNVHWHTESRYDLVTVNNPDSGTWTIDADIDPDNRVMVVTDLKLLSNKIPNSLLQGDKLFLEAHLEQQGSKISNRDFLHFVSGYVNQMSFNKKRTKPNKVKLNDRGVDGDTIAHDGIYSAVLDNTLTAGEHEIELVFNGTTFKRYIHHQVKIYSSPVSMTLDNDDTGHIRLSIIPYQSLIDTKAIRLIATHTSPNGEVTDYKISRKSSSEWSLEIMHGNVAGEHTVTLHIVGKTTDGKAIDETLNPQTINIGQVAKAKKKDIAIITSTTNDAPKNDSSVNWTMVSLRVLVFNILLAITVFGCYKLWPIIITKLSPMPSKELVNG